MTPTRYEEHADWYTAYSSPWQHDGDAVVPGDIGGLRILDLACGWGQLSRQLAARGAQVTGVDASAALLARASRESTAGVGQIRYLQGDACDVMWWDADPFDLVVCNMALMDIDDLDAALGTAARVLRPGGVFVINLFHPCFPGDAESDPSWPPGGYADESWWSTDKAGVRGHVGANHRRLSTYLNALLRAGFTPTAFDEGHDPLPTTLRVRSVLSTGGASGPDRPGGPGGHSDR